MLKINGLSRLLKMAIVVLLSFNACNSNKNSNDQHRKNIPTGSENIAYKWGKVALKATALDTRRNTPRPTITSRYLGLIFISVFDAWSRYDSLAQPVYLKDIKRRPNKEHTLSNKEKAISYAAYYTLMEYYPADSLLFQEFMNSMNYKWVTDFSDKTTPHSIGYHSAQAVIKARFNDGSNHYGEEPGSNQKQYFNYIHYQPVNTTQKNVDINRWQPKDYINEQTGEVYNIDCLTPFWNLVEPVSLDSASQFRPGPPPLFGSEQLKNEIREVVELQSNITDYQKALVEFMRDGPESVQQAGHWLKFAQDISVRDQHTLDQDVQMYFYNQLVALDAFIASWDAKMHYDFARPYALIREMYKDSLLIGWGGEGQPFKQIKGSEWRPYSPKFFLCPPFPSYVSGHSCVSGACAEALKIWTGSDTFGVTIQWVAGSLTEPGYLGDTVILEFPTFTETAEMAGISRVLGGYHIQADNIAGLKLGRDVARNAWNFYREHMGIKINN